MPDVDITPPEAARQGVLAGLPLPAARHAEVAAAANHVRSVVGVLRELDFADIPPAAAYRAEEHDHNAAQ